MGGMTTEEYIESQKARIGELERDLLTATIPGKMDSLRCIIGSYRASHKECVDLAGHPDALPSQRKDWRCDLCKRADEVTQPLTARNDC